MAQHVEVGPVTGYVDGGVREYRPCPRCKKRELSHDGPLEFCEGCGYETKESERRYPLAPRVLARLSKANDDDEDAAGELAAREGRLRMAEPVVAVSSADEIVRASRARVAAIEKYVVEREASLGALKAERSQLLKVIALLDPSSVPPVVKGLVCPECGKPIRDNRGMGIHRARMHGVLSPQRTAAS
jgi:uncharacterized Zn finger protein (UPF0148 family)